MKKININLVLLTCILTVISKFVIAQAPGVLWQGEYHPPYRNLNAFPYGNDVTKPQTAEQSGSDWMYDIKPLYNPTTEFSKSYVAAGFATFVNHWLRDGKNCTTPGDNDVDYQELESPSTSTCGFRMKGGNKPAIMRVGSDGKQLWYRTYGDDLGELRRVMQSTQDHAIYAAGVSDCYSSDQSIVVNDNTSHPNYKPADIDGCGTAGHFYIIKTDMNGTPIWHGVYHDEVDDATGYTATTSIATDLVEVGAYIYAVGYKTYSYPTSLDARKQHVIFFVKIDASNGHMVDHYEYAITKFSNVVADANGDKTYEMFNFKNVSVEYFNNKFYIYTSKEIWKYNSAHTRLMLKGNPTVLVLNASNTLLNQVPNEVAMDLNVGNTFSWHLVYDIKHYVDNNGDSKMALSLVANYTDTDIPHNIRNGGDGLVVYVKVSTLDDPTNNLTMLAPSLFNILNIGTVSAYDPQVGITTYTDISNKKELLIVTSKHINPIDPNDLYFSCCTNQLISAEKVSQWESDAVVIKTKNNGLSVDFESIFDFDDGNRGTCFPQDIKKQECVYKILVDPDDQGIVICGNNSNNFDDSYIAKLHNECYAQIMQVGITTTTLDGSNNIDVNLQGGTLTIDHKYIIASGGKMKYSNGTIYMMDGGTGSIKNQLITVEKGGVLELDNVTITNIPDGYGGQSCVSKTIWDGILVLGDPAKDQTIDGTNSFYPNHGWVKLTNCTLENAKTAITSGNNTDQLKNGGVITATNCIFKNNFVAVALMKFDKTNASTFTKCDFLIDNMMQNMTYGVRCGKHFVNMWGVKDVEFIGCSFKNTLTNLTLADGNGFRTEAFRCIDADYKVRSYITDKNNPRSGWTQSVFDGVAIGVSNVSTTGSNKTEVRGAQFKNVHQALYLQGTSKDHVTNNTFLWDANFQTSTFPDQATAYNTGVPFGIYTTGAKGLQIERNDMEWTSGPGTFQGLLVANSGSEDFAVTKNTFSKNLAIGAINPTVYGNTFLGDNGLLLATRNTYTALNQDWLIQDDGSTAAQFADQFTGTSAGGKFPEADNTFSTGSSGTSAINSSISFTYFYLNNILPAAISGNVVGDNKNSLAATTYTDIQNDGDFLTPIRVTWKMALQGETPEAAIDMAPDTLKNEVRKKAILVLLSMGEHLRAADQLAQLPTEELNTPYGKYTSMLLDVQNQGFKLNQLPACKLQFLRELASQTGNIKMNVQAMLELNGAMQPPRPICIPPSQKGDSKPTYLALQTGETISLFPNPADESIQIVANEALETLTLMNTLGEIILLPKVNKGQNTLTLDIRNLSTGIYFLQVKSANNKMQTHKICIKH